MGWPQWTWIVLAAIGWLFTLSKHGETRTDKYDIGIQTAALGVAIFLLWQGGCDAFRLKEDFVVRIIKDGYGKGYIAFLEVCYRKNLKADGAGG